MNKVNLREKFALFADHWSPKVVGGLNGQQVKLVKFQGEFVWHKHDSEDELFFVVRGRFRMEFRDQHVGLEEGEFLIVPRGVEHRPVAEEEVHVLLFEPATTLAGRDLRLAKRQGNGISLLEIHLRKTGHQPAARQTAASFCASFAGMVAPPRRRKTSSRLPDDTV